MNTDQHPALFTKHYDPPSLTLVLPGDLDNDQVLKRLAQAIGEFRTNLAAHVQRSQQIVERDAARGDQLGQALGRGQVLAYGNAASTLDEAITEVFDLWPQYQTQLDRQAEDPQLPPGAPGGTQGTGDLTVQADVAGTGEPHSPPGG
jgi:hypothetical protein